MTYSSYGDASDCNPLDCMKDIASRNGWTCDYITDNQVAVDAKGAYSGYMVTLAEQPKSLMLVSAFEARVKKKKLA